MNHAQAISRILEKRSTQAMMTLTPAYGRDYTSAAAVRKDLTADKDFIINEFGNRYDGKPVNASELKGKGSVKVRYKNLTKVIVEVF